MRKTNTPSLCHACTSSSIIRPEVLHSPIEITAFICGLNNQRGYKDGTASQSFQTRAESEQAANWHLELAVFAYRRGRAGELGLRLGAARYRAFAERVV